MSEERGRLDRRIRTDRCKYDRQTESKQTDADRTGRRNRIKQTQTEVRQGDNIRLRWTSEDTDKTTTEQQRSQFAVVKDDEQLIVDILAATSNTNTTMPAADIDDSPLTMARTWEEVFGRLDQWDVVDKLRALHLKSSTSTSSTGFLQFKSPDISHLVANTARRVRLFHHFHHDMDDGLNDGTDELWALMGSGAMAERIVRCINIVHNFQKSSSPFLSTVCVNPG
jgi:hypothetical protein